MHSSSLLLPLALAGGCVTRVEGEVPLTDAHKIEMAEYMRQEPLATAMAVELARTVTVGTVDAAGTSSTAEALALDVRATADWLRSAYTEGRIMEADTSKFSTVDAIAQYDPGDTEAHSDDHIVVSSDATLWSLETLMHEAGHKKFWHDAAVTQEIREAGAQFNEGFADAVIMHKDYAFLLTALYNIPSSIVRENQKVIDSAHEKAESTADSGDWLKAMRELKDDLLMRTHDEAETYLREISTEQSGMFEQFGTSTDAVVDTYFSSGLHELLTAAREECRAEFHAEYIEHLAESRRERKVW